MYGLNLVLFGLMFGLVTLPEVQLFILYYPIAKCHEHVFISLLSYCHSSLCLDSHGSSLWRHSQENRTSGRAAHSHGLLSAL